MKFIRLIIIITVLFVCFVPAVRAGNDLLPRWELGAEISSYHYEEPRVMEEDGSLAGLTAAFTYYDAAMLRLEGRAAYGKVDYYSPISGTMSDITDYLFEGRLLAGFGVAESYEHLTIIYSGIGYRYLNDDSAGKSSVVGFVEYRGYERESNYAYVPFGVMAIKRMDASWVADLQLEFDMFLYGKQKSHLSDAGLGDPDIENDQKSGYGVKVSLRFRHEGANASRVYIGPYVRYWDIDESEVSQGYIEPENNSWEWGLAAGITY